MSQWGPLFLDLIDHPRVVPYLLELVGPKFRIDHDYNIFMHRGESQGEFTEGLRNSAARAITGTATPTASSAMGLPWSPSTCPTAIRGTVVSPASLEVTSPA